LPDGLTTIQKQAFLNCSSLTEITVPESVTSIGNQALGFATDENLVASPVEDFVITGVTGTAAATYAAASGVTFDDPNAPTTTEPIETTTTADDTSNPTESTETTTVTTESPSETDEQQEGSCGDTNLDGVVNLNDAIVLNKYLAGQNDFTEQQMLNANCDISDGTSNIDDKDSSALMGFVIMLIDTLPVTE
jgi:hypothetical protein